MSITYILGFQETFVHSFMYHGTLSTLKGASLLGPDYTDVFWWVGVPSPDRYKGAMKKK